MLRAWIPLSPQNRQGMPAALSARLIAPLAQITHGGPSTRQEMCTQYMLYYPKEKVPSELIACGDNFSICTASLCTPHAFSVLSPHDVYLFLSGSPETLPLVHKAFYTC